MYYWYDVRGHAENGEQTTWVWDQNQIDYVQHNVSGQVNVDKETLSLALVTMGNYILEMAARRHHRPYSVLQQGQWAAMLDQVRQQFIDRFDWQHFDVATMPTQWRDELRDSSQDMFIPFLGLHRDNVTVNLADWAPYQQDLMILLEYLAYAAWAEERRRSEERDSHMVDNDE
ncbi:Hypothetical predicted protein [Lecanosticta acicola]|uniref:Uncharacterized protein n=1 Tax=Lecanosticta acicola TaxID=111012 RepID=A0AAI8Z4G0_9PEZI|nr:Hypothetical predicted protein [Lecanosticta acicola]